MTMLKLLVVVATLSGVATFSFAKVENHGAKPAPSSHAQAPRPIATRGPGILDPKTEAADVENMLQLSQALKSLNQLNTNGSDLEPTPVGERKPNSLRSMGDF